MAKLLRRIACMFGWHTRLDVIQTFGAAQRIGCPDCRRQFGIHHEMRAVIPWTSDMTAMYEAFGHETRGPLKRWLQHLDRRKEPPHE